MRKSMKLARKLLLSGVLIVFPLAVTVWLVAAIFRAINGTVTRLVRAILGWSGIALTEGLWWERLLPLAGILVSVALLMAVGLLATNLVGRRVIRVVERLLLAIPLVSVVYSSAKQLLEAFTGHQDAFREVVALEYPRKGCWALGFVTSVTQGTLWKEAGDDEMVQVFVPTSPNPTSGMMLILPASSVRRVDLSVEQAIKMIVSGGLVLPPSLMRRAPEGPGPVIAMFYAIIKALAWPWRKFYFRMAVHGLENFPQQGPGIVVANHSSYLDAGVLGSALPRPIHFVVLTRMFNLRRLRWFYVGMETIAVDPGAGRREPIRRCLEVLNRGHVVGIFPEGSRSTDGRLGEPQAGAAMLAKRSGAPVIPVGIRGAFEAFPRAVWIPRPRKIQMRVGKPLHFADALGEGAGQRDAMRLFTSKMMSSIADLMLPQEGQELRAPERAR